ncbi:unnamed protein product [Ilex paraguariensis]|uniref:Condensation domain-containing protein n=1 Tax=Ilex paraguariensis TaxID=185542 RepID=A0ABC8SRI7_9AQUA
MSEPKCRPVGLTEYSWCKAVPGGTGITVLALLISKPIDLSLLQNALHQLQKSHPILNSKLRHNTTINSFSYTTPSTPHLQIQLFDLQSTSDILQGLTNPNNSSMSHFHLILEREINTNTWCANNDSLDSEIDVFFASVYTLRDDRWAVMLRLHTSACDRTSAVSLLRELLGLICEGKKEELELQREVEEEMEVGLGIEDCIPPGKANKPFWARGVDILGYSLNSLRLANLNFKDIDSPRSSQVVKLQLNSDDTDRILLVSGISLSLVNFFNKSHDTNNS